MGLSKKRQVEEFVKREHTLSLSSEAQAEIDRVLLAGLPLEILEKGLSESIIFGCSKFLAEWQGQHAK